MSETQTTAERIEIMLGVHYDWTGRVIEAGIDTAAAKIAAEIDALTAERDAALKSESHLVTLHLNAVAERDAARAEVKRLRPAAEAWEAMDNYFLSNGDMVVVHRLRNHADEAWMAARRAREAAKGQA